MKVKPELLIVFLLFSCVYDPPPEGKEVIIHNQTDKPLLIVDSLNDSSLTLYDTASVNGRSYIRRRPYYVPEHGIYSTVLATDRLTNNKLNTITLYFIDKDYLRSTPKAILTNHLYRSFQLSIDSLKKHYLNHLFVTNDTILFEHSHDLQTFGKQEEKE